VFILAFSSAAVFFFQTFLWMIRIDEWKETPESFTYLIKTPF